MTRRELLEQRIAEARTKLAGIEAEINDPQTPASRVPGLENRKANLERRISEMEQELANLPVEIATAAGPVAAALELPQPAEPMAGTAGGTAPRARARKARKRTTAGKRGIKRPKARRDPV